MRRHPLARARARPTRVALFPGAPVLLAALALVWAPGAPPAAAGGWPCAASRVHHRGYSGAVTVPTYAVTYDTTIADTHAARLTFDRVAGRATLSAASGGVFWVELRVLECLDVVGVPTGTPVDAVLQLEVEGWSTQNCGGSGCGVLLDATVAVGADSASANATQQGPAGGRVVPLVGTPAVPIHFVAGAPVTAHVVLRYGTGPGGGGAQGVAAGTWRVIGLRDGVRAVGSAGSDLTPVRPATWGRVKALYR
uniref:Uncharacterized protein n=1 Tax=Eiseniibacteriota bacterium TaxID=2212470 RepID=A0A832HYY5_UNCEI